MYFTGALVLPCTYQFYWWLHLMFRIKTLQRLVLMKITWKLLKMMASVAELGSPLRRNLWNLNRWQSLWTVSNWLSSCCLHINAIKSLCAAETQLLTNRLSCVSNLNSFNCATSKRVNFPNLMQADYSRWSSNNKRISIPGKICEGKVADGLRIVLGISSGQFINEFRSNWNILSGSK